MKTRAWIWHLPLIVLTVGLAGCNPNGNQPQPEPAAEPAAEPPPQQSNRGVFEATACAEANRVGVPADAAYAVYLDANGNLLGEQAEDLLGTAGKLMCPTPAESGPGACPAGYCPRAVAGKTYCLRC